MRSPIIAWFIGAIAVCQWPSTAAIATCPTPLATQTLASFPAEAAYLSYAETLFRVANATTGDYGIMLRYGQQAAGALGVQYNAAHQMVWGSYLAGPSNNNFGIVGIDAVDIGGTGPNRWVTQWNNVRPPDAYRAYTRFATYGLDFQTPWSSLVDLWPPQQTYEQERGSTAIALLPNSRRLVHVAAQVQQHASNSCQNGTHFERRALMAIRESATGAFVPGVEKKYVSDTCSYHSSSTGQGGWGQQDPDVSASWFLGDWFVVTWYDRRSTTCGVYARVFNANGSPVTNEIFVDQPVADCNVSFETSPRVAALGAGFVVVWGRANQQVMMRTFNFLGSPLIAARPVNAQTLPKGANPEVTIAMSDVCGEYQVFIAVSWWARTGSASGPWTPQMMVYQDLTDPLPIIPGAGYLEVDSASQARFDPLVDRVSIDSFNKFTASDSACTDLTVGMSWTMAVPPNESYDYLRRRVVRFQPSCSDVLGEGITANRLGETEISDCQEPECFVFQARPSPSSEPEQLVPEALE